MTSQADAVMDELGRAISSRDISRLRALYKEDVVVWHAATGQRQSKEENCALLQRLFEITSQLCYRNVRRFSIEGGAVQQHCLTGRFSCGTDIPELEVCMVVKVEDGKIISLDEYFDVATFNPVWERLGV
jgi:ketosteroid isomerase-like protein